MNNTITYIVLGLVLSVPILVMVLLDTKSWSQTFLALSRVVLMLGGIALVLWVGEERYLNTGAFVAWFAFKGHLDLLNKFFPDRYDRAKNILSQGILLCILLALGSFLSTILNIIF